ncbi:hypothetical protein [Lewinella sp. IMCC34191]|uniref:hypothetical protein n=1 Tax=Lewinella sp. IMCC34191 TaxID=2259172 RepID=UPI0018E4F45B|nr:hypothetical protein [Lewinella sp. IMCC34191]
MFKWSSLSLYFGDNFYQTDQTNSLLGWVAPGVLNWLYTHYEIFMFGVLVLAAFTMFGIGRRLSIVGLLVGISLYQHAMFLALNGGDNLLFFGVLYLCFARSFDYFCLFRTDRDRETKSNYRYRLSLTASNLAALSIMLHLCLVYMVSALHKIHSDVWFNGTALYYILNIDRFSGPLSDVVRNNAFLVTAGTYFTLVFELLFPILVWFPLHRPWLLVSGWLLHLGIYTTMMIFDFELYFMATYGFFIANASWLAVYARFNNWVNRLGNHLALNPSTSLSK